MIERNIITDPISPGSLPPLRNSPQAWIPSLTAPFISLTRNTRFGRGVIVPVTVAANTPVTITHNLGRLVQGMLAISNGANGELFTPQLARTIGGGSVRTPEKQSIQGNLAMTSCLVWVI